MSAYQTYLVFFILLLLSGSWSPASAQELLRFIEAKEHAGVLQKANGIKIADDGVVFVTSAEKGTLLRIADGNIETHELSPAVFEDDELGGIDVLPDGRLVIVNQGSGKVGVLGPDLAAETLFSQSGKAAGEMSKPRPVAVSVNRRIFVGDVRNKRISVFNHQGLFLYTIGNQGDSDRDILRPTHVSIDAAENVYVLEGPSRLSIFDPQGNLIERISADDLQPYFGETPELSAMTTDLSGNLYLGDDVSSRITIYDWRRREVLGQFGTLGQSRAQYLKIAQLSVNARGQIAILDTKNGKIEVFQLESTEFAEPQSSDQLELGAEVDAACVALAAFVEDKTLCIRPKNQGIAVLTADGSEAGRFAEQAQKPQAVHVGRDSVAVLDKNKLHVFDFDGNNLFTTGRYGTSAGGFKDPGHVFVHDGKYYVSDRGNNRIQVFAADGQFVEEINEQKDGERLFFEVGPIAVDSHENLYVADAGGAAGAAKIQVINKERRKIASIGFDGKSPHRFTRFYGLDVDQQDRLYVLGGSEFTDFSVRIYQDFRLFKAFGAEGNNGTLAYFDEASSVSVLSAAKNSVYVNDSKRNKHFRFDLLEYPDQAFGLNIAADRKSVNLAWSSSQSPLIEKYEIEAARHKQGPWKAIASSTRLSHSITNEIGRDYTWFRIVSVSAYGLRAPPSAAKQNYFQTIAELYHDGKYAEAVKLADKLLKIAPENADARDFLAMSLFRLEDYTRAISEFRQLASRGAYRNKAIRYQVRAHYELEQFLDARALINEVLEQDPADVEPYLLCTRLSLQLADAIGAMTCAEDGLDKHGGNVELRYLLGRAYIEAGIVEDGLLAYATIVESNPENHAIRLQIADDLYQLGEFEAALEHYEAIVAALPESGPATFGQARSLLSLDRDDEARSIALELSGNKETRGDGYYLLGKIAAKQGEHKEAVLRLTRAGKDKPGLVDAWLSLANSYVEINQLAQAAKSLAQGIENNPDAFALYALAGQIELEREQYAEANAYLDTAVRLNPQALQAQKLYARGLYATRNYHSAALHAEAAARIAPADIDVLVLQADIANRQGKTVSAIEFLKTAISLDPASPELQFHIGRVYQGANLFDKSREHLDRAAAIRPSWAAPQVALGNLYLKRRLFDDAIAAYEKATELDPSEDNRAMLNLAIAERKKSLEFDNNAPQLLLSDLNLQTVFSAAYKKYQEQPIGSVKLQNVSASDYGNLKLSFQIREFMDFPSMLDIDLIKGEEILEIPIRATFNNKILEVDEDTGVQVEVRLSYQRDGQKDEITLTQPMTIYGKNAIVWRDAQMIGSFVTPKDDIVRDYVRQVANSYQPEAGPLNDKLVAAMAFFSSLTAAGTKYTVDPNTPFAELRDDQVDYVQFPRETLRLKSGDCDDLSVLISAGLENLGIRTAFIEVPGHLFLMFDTGLKAEEAELISQDTSLLAIKDGNVWIPLEATMVNTSFNEAWAEGARKYQTALAAGQLGIIDLQQAWQRYKPVTLRKAGYSIDLPERQRTESLVRQARNLLLAKSIGRLVLPYQTMVANDPKNIAARLQIAILYARYGLYEDAEIAFEALDELAPDNSAVKTNQGNLYYLQGDYARAIENYEQAAALDAEDGRIWINLSMAQFKAGELQNARNSYKRAVQLDNELKEEYDAYSKLLSQ